MWCHLYTRVDFCQKSDGRMELIDISIHEIFPGDQRKIRVHVDASKTSCCLVLSSTLLATPISNNNDWMNRSDYACQQIILSHAVKINFHVDEALTN